MDRARRPAKSACKLHKFTLVACARWERESIVEWLVYHRHIGIDHVYLYCNDDDPAELYEAVLPFTAGNDPYVDFLHHPVQGEQAQMYLHFLRNHAQECEWGLFLDIDEFLVLKGGLTLEQLTATSADAIYLNWAMVGSNGHKTRPAGPVWKNYDRRAHGVHPFTKPLFRTSSVDPAKLLPNHFWHDVRSLLKDGAKIVDTAGRDATSYYDDFPAGAMARICDLAVAEGLTDAAYLLHIFMKSDADAERRFARGTGGAFFDQGLWKRAHENDPDDFAHLMATHSALEENHLKEVWADILSGARRSTLDQ